MREGASRPSVHRIRQGSPEAFSRRRRTGWTPPMGCVRRSGMLAKTRSRGGAMERARGDHSRPSGMCDAHQGGRGAVVERLTLDLRSCGVVATGSWRCTRSSPPTECSHAHRGPIPAMRRVMTGSDARRRSGNQAQVRQGRSGAASLTIRCFSPTWQASPRYPGISGSTSMASCVSDSCQPR